MATSPQDAHILPPRIFFTVDAALLRELGARLVGKPHIALAELIKNSYDADAHVVKVYFGHGTIHIADNGHGMNQHAFKNFWMRIGSPHKQDERVSMTLGRPLTGSKGVGRLAVQFLAQRIAIRTSFKDDPDNEILAKVNWNDATQAGDLVKAFAECTYRPRSAPFPDGKTHGTEISLFDLNQQWSPEFLKELGREVWFLQPPFRSVQGAGDFRIELAGADPGAANAFSEQMNLHLDNWEARLVGKLTSDGASARLHLDLQFATVPHARHQYEHPMPGIRVHELEFEIRVYKHQFRQRGGLKLKDLRDYFNEWGGVHVYDAGFRLPYYGQADADWLETELVHAHRRSVSRLLPAPLQVKDGLNNIPTRSRLFGVVHVNSQRERATATERGGAEATEHLLLQVTRDRLVENGAYEDLRRCLQFALHFYAMKQTERMVAEKVEKKGIATPPKEALRSVEDTLEKYRQDIPPKIFKELERDLTAAVEASNVAEEVDKGRVGLLGALATAGIAALAYEHEVAKQLELIRDVGAALRRLSKTSGSARKKILEISTQIEEWVERARGTRSLFAPLLNEQNRVVRGRFPAKSVVQTVADQTAPILGGTRIDTTCVDQWLRLPRAGLIEWNAIFQNVFVNASNAMVESDEQLISVSSTSSAGRRAILVHDTGCGVDVASSGELFEPFIRRTDIPISQRAFGLGGSGLGLTIVKMVAEEIGCSVAFIAPERGFKTCFELSWRET